MDENPTTTTDPLAADTDGDDLADGDEDVNANGAVDPGETAADSDDSTVACDASQEDPGCPADFVCESGGCIPAPVDPGTPDAGSTDPGVADAGTTDSGAPSDGGGCSSSSGTSPMGDNLLLISLLAFGLLWRRRQHCQQVSG